MIYSFIILDKFFVELGILFFFTCCSFIIVSCFNICIVVIFVQNFK